MNGGWRGDPGTGWRFRALLVLLALPAVVAVGLAAAYVRAGLAHRAAVEEASVRVAGVIQRDVFDLLFNRVARGTSPVMVGGANRLLLEGLAQEQLRAGDVARETVHVRDSLRACAACDRRAPLLSVAVRDPVTGELAVAGVEPGEPAPPWEARFAALDEPPPSNRLGTYAARDPGGSVWFGYFLLLPRGDDPPLTIGAEVDLDRLGTEIIEPSLVQAVRNQVGTDEELEALVGLEVTHPAGPVVYRRGPVGQGPTHRMPLFGRDIVTTTFSDSRPFSAALSLHPDVVATMIPGGLPASPWPLAGASVVFAVVLTALAFLLLLRVRQLAALREEFVASVSHELRTPLAQILAYAETLQLERPTPEARRRAATVIVREARNLSHLVENTLSFVRGRRPEAGLDVHPLPVARAAREVVAGMEETARQRAVRVEVDIPEDLTVQADAQGFRRILANLLENAVRHGPSGEPVRVEGARRNGHVLLAVEDRGPGVSESDRERIWRPFQRIPAGPGDTGAGLGLAIVRQLAELHDGDAWVEDARECGARFVVRLPAADGQPGGGEEGHGGMEEEPWPGS